MPDLTKTGVDADIEREIIRTLNDIGFPPEVSHWKEAPAMIDPDGTTLRVLGHPVMESWEEPYMRKLADIAVSRATHGRVLELGFGLGLSSGFIQSHGDIEEHVIIEMNASIAANARKFAVRQSQRVTVLEGLWQDVVPSLPDGSFHGILFDTYPMSEEEVDQIFYPFLEHAFRLLRPGGRFTYYSDEAGWFSPHHVEELKRVGFNKIDGVIVAIPAPPQCKYWRQNSILAPIIER